METPEQPPNLEPNEQERRLIDKYGLTNTEWLRYRLTGELPERPAEETLPPTNIEDDQENKVTTVPAETKKESLEKNRMGGLLKELNYFLTPNYQNGEKIPCASPVYVANVFEKNRNIKPDELEALIPKVEQACLKKIDVLSRAQIILRGDSINKKDRAVENMTLSGVRNLCIPVENEQQRMNILWNLVGEIYARYSFAKRYEEKSLEQEKETTPVLMYGIKDTSEAETETRGSSTYFWGHADDIGGVFKNTKLIKFPTREEDGVTPFMPPYRDQREKTKPEIRQRVKDFWGGKTQEERGFYGHNISEALLGSETYFNSLLIANAILLDTEAYAADVDMVKNYEKFRQEHAETPEANEADFKVFRKKIPSDELKPENYKAIVKYQIRYWHDDFKPDYIFLTETSALPAGYMFKEAWKAAYPLEEPPLFFRVNPNAMNLDPETSESPEYQEKLKEYLGKRIKKGNARVAIFDEQPISGKSQRVVKEKLMETLHIPAENIDVTRNMYLFGMDIFASGAEGAEGLKLTHKTGGDSGSRVYEKYSYEYRDSLDDVKFTGEINSPHGGFVTRKGHKGVRVNLTDLISDFRLVGRMAGEEMIKRAISRVGEIQDNPRGPANKEVKEETNYLYFSPERYFEKGFVDSDMAAKLLTGGTLLTVGTGKGDLETAICKKFNVPEKQISIADIKLHSAVKNLPFTKYEFDMEKKWSVFPNKFDYILFPESFGVALGGEEEAHRFFEQIKDVVEKSNRDEKINKDDEDLFNIVLEMDIPHVKDKLFTVEQALLNLNDNGELRFSGDLLSSQEETYIRLKLKQEFPEIDMGRNKDGILIIKKS